MVFEEVWTHKLRAWHTRKVFCKKEEEEELNVVVQIVRWHIIVISISKKKAIPNYVLCGRRAFFLPLIYLRLLYIIYLNLFEIIYRHVC